MFIGRLLKRRHWSVRKSSIAQCAPANWKLIALQTSESIRLDFKSCDHVIAMDETFVRFHEIVPQFIVPTGTKRVGCVNGADNEKSGISLLVAADLTLSRLLPPFIIAKGGFGKDLMKAWHSYQKSTVVFNETHWMNQTVAIMFLNFMVKLLPGKSIG